MKIPKSYIIFLIPLLSLDAEVTEISGFFANNLTYYDMGDTATALGFYPDSFSVNTALSHELTLSLTFQENIQARMTSGDALGLGFCAEFWRDGITDSVSIWSYFIDSRIDFYNDGALVGSGTAMTYQRGDGQRISFNGNMHPVASFTFDQIKFTVATNPIFTGEISNYIATDASLVGWDYQGLDRTTLELISVPESSRCALLASAAMYVFVAIKRRKRQYQK